MDVRAFGRNIETRACDLTGIGNQHLIEPSRLDRSTIRSEFEYSDVVYAVNDIYAIIIKQ